MSVEYVIPFGPDGQLLRFTVASAKDAHKAGAVYGMMPKKCTKCNSVDVHLTHKSPGGNDYYGIRCRTCQAEMMFHQRKEGGFYIKYDDEMKVWTPGDKGATSKEPQIPEDPSPPQIDADVPDEIPF